jgi:hypothetical protein
LEKFDRVREQNNLSGYGHLNDEYDAMKKKFLESGDSLDEFVRISGRMWKPVTKEYPKRTFQFFEGNVKEKVLRVMFPDWKPQELRYVHT